MLHQLVKCRYCDCPNYHGTTFVTSRKLGLLVPLWSPPLCFRNATAPMKLRAVCLRLLRRGVVGADGGRDCEMLKSMVCPSAQSETPFTG